ncbi:MAG: tetratricopeptide repeat protein [Kouleothrix sp.]|nr:tetratricopeptide repeat protein [Kouleothrix sp.]
MEQPEAYIPIDRRLALARGADLPDRASGAALFADISGFTPLTELLARDLGPQRGAEELTRQLIVIYSALIAKVDQHHGSVIGFSGDAITCWFDEKDEGGRMKDEAKTDTPSSSFILHSSALRAVACALAMQQVIGQFATVETPSGARVTLAIKVAVAAGPVRRFLVGDPGIQLIDVLAGATLDRLAAAEHAAAKGEVLASAEVAGALGELLLVNAWREDQDGRRFAVVGGLAREVAATPWPAVAPGELREDHVRPWLLPGVYERLRDEQAQFLAELRPAVALFARFGGIDYDGDERASRKLDGYIRWVQRIVARYEGALLQLTIGDKGSYFYVAFGAPIAHDDDPDRAVAAALELQAPPPALAGIVGTQIGISRGRMRTGAYGGPTRHTYGVLGDEVNMAARLMGRAEPGQIVVSQPIADAVARRFTLRALGPVSVKGKQAPVHVSLVLDRRQPSSQRPATLFASPLVGREAELERMEQALDAARSGAGQVLRVVGAAGVGKSHLAAELAERALQRGMRVAVGSCQSTTESTAYAPWRQVVRALLAIDAEPGARQIAAIERFVAATNPDWLVRLPLLGDLLGLPIADNATTAAFEPRLRQGALFELVVELAQVWARPQPLLLLIDDAHWMDEASKGLTLALGRALGKLPLLLALVHRPAQAGAPLLPELDALPIRGTLSLDELSPQGVATLVANRLGGPVSPLALSLIQAETQGNPFFVEEVVDTLRESGSLHLRANDEWGLSERMFNALQQASCLTHADDRWVLAPSASLSAVDLGLPESIQGVVLSRIDRLPEAHKLTLKVASVIGRSFALDLLARAHPTHAGQDELIAQIGLLEERDFTRMEGQRRLMYLFKHTVTRDVAYETLLFDQRRQLHHVVGEALEQLASDATPQLAYHAFAGEDWPRALRYQALAGQQAQKLFANYEGVEFFRKALRCAEHLPAEQTAVERQEIHIRLGELLTNTGQYEPALEQLQAALALAVAGGDTDAQARACRWIARLHEHRGEYPLALDWIQRGLQFLGRRETAATVELLAIGGLINTRQGDLKQALRQCDSCVQMAEQLADPTSLAFAYTSRAHVFLRLSSSAAAVADVKAALALYEQAGNIHGQALSYNGLGNTYFEISQWSDADGYYRQARAIFSQTGDVLRLAFTNNNLAEIARYQGRLADALAFYQEALRSLEQVGASLYMIGVLHMNLGATFVQRGEIDAAIEHLRTGEQKFTQLGTRDFLPELYRHFGAAALAGGRLAEAEARGRQALDLARELMMRGEEGTSLRVLGVVANAQGDTAHAARCLSQSIAILEELGDEYEAARSRLALVEVLLAQGQADQAQLELERCTAVFERLDAVVDLAAAGALRERLARPR